MITSMLQIGNIKNVLQDVKNLNKVFNIFNFILF